MRKFYTETVILLDRDLTTGGYPSTGGYWSTSTGADYTTAASLMGAINLLDGRERFYGDGFTVRATHKLYCDVSTEVVHGRRLRAIGSTFEVIEDPKDPMRRGHHYEVLLKEVDGV